MMDDNRQEKRIKYQYKICTPTLGTLLLNKNVLMIFNNTNSGITEGCGYNAGKNMCLAEVLSEDFIRLSQRHLIVWIVPITLCVEWIYQTVDISTDGYQYRSILLFIECDLIILPRLKG